MLQIDASVNTGNSGGPLIDPISGDAIGIVTRKATGLTSAFEGFRDSIKRNIDQINKAMQGMDFSMGGISYKRVLLVGQSQLMNLANELERSANVGIGYAFSSCHLREDPQAVDLHFENH